MEKRIKDGTFATEADFFTRKGLVSHYRQNHRHGGQNCKEDSITNVPQEIFRKFHDGLLVLFLGNECNVSTKLN